MSFGMLCIKCGRPLGPTRDNCPEDPARPCEGPLKHAAMQPGEAEFRDRLQKVWDNGLDHRTIAAELREGR